MDSHLVGVPSLGTLTVRGLSGGDLQDLGWHSNWTLLGQVVLGSVSDNVVADVLQLLDLGGSQGDSDLQEFLLLLFNLLFNWSRHFGDDITVTLLEI